MKAVYPIAIVPCDEGDYVVKIPDFDIMTQGEDIADAIDMARDAISLMGVEYEDEGKAIPQPSDITELKAEANEILTLVDVDFLAYRKMLDNRTVRKNCTIPSWLNIKAEAAGVNFSAVLQKALREELHIA